MLKVKETIVVEGKYDKNTLLQAVDASVIETDGFGIFSDREKVKLLKRLAEKNGLIILTDSDSAGFLIRNYLKGSLKGEQIKHAYIPDIFGKEKRKISPSKEGKLGVEGMAGGVITDALRRAGATFEGEEALPKEKSSAVTKADLYELGISGGKDSARKRHEVMKKLDLPENLSSNAFLDVINVLYTREEFLAVIDRLFPQ